MNIYFVMSEADRFVNEKCDIHIKGERQSTGTEGTCCEECVNIVLSHTQNLEQGYPELETHNLYFWELGDQLWVPLLKPHSFTTKLAQSL